MEEGGGVERRIGVRVRCCIVDVVEGKRFDSCSRRDFFPGPVIPVTWHCSGSLARRLAL